MDVDIGNDICTCWQLLQNSDQDIDECEWQSEGDSVRCLDWTKVLDLRIWWMLHSFRVGGPFGYTSLQNKLKFMLNEFNFFSFSTFCEPFTIKLLSWLALTRQVEVSLCEKGCHNPFPYKHQTLLGLWSCVPSCMRNTFAKSNKK